MLLSCVFKPESFAVGASTSVFGLVGFYISYIFTNWQYMINKNAIQLGYLSILTIVIVLVNMNLGPMADGTVDNFGHLGGLATGILVGLTFAEWYDFTARRKKRIPDRFTDQEWKFRDKYCNNFFCNYIFTFLLLAYFVTFLCLFYLWTDVNAL